MQTRHSFVETVLEYGSVHQPVRFLKTTSGPEDLKRVLACFLEYARRKKSAGAVFVWGSTVNRK